MRLPELVVHDGGLVRAGEGAWNMAVDEVLHRTAERPTLRVYAWEEAWLSIGYFSRFGVAEAFAEASGVGRRRIVRRLTGGGMVPHGRDLTFSLAIPAEWLKAAPGERIAGGVSAHYQWIHEEVAGALEEIGVHGLGWAPCEGGAEGRAVGDGAAAVEGACFQAPVRHDLMRDGRKLVGGAQKRSRSGLLHQGSIQLEGIPDAFVPALAARLADRVHAAGHGLRPDQRSLGETLVASRYADDAWLMRC